MPDAVEEAKSVAYTLDTRSVYTRIGKLLIIIVSFLFHCTRLFHP
jgi:hypothetical protein